MTDSTFRFLSQPESQATNLLHDLQRRSARDLIAKAVEDGFRELAGSWGLENGKFFYV